jgi:hypothetical protein
MATVGVLLVILLHLLAVPFLASADAFCDNVRSIAATLPKKTSSSPEHFATATFGQAPDTVYALALCRGDVLDDSACAGCLTSAFDLQLNLTPSPEQQCNKTANYYSNCILIYSVDDILAAPPNATGIGGTNPFQMWNLENDSRLNAGARIQELLVQTVEEVAASTIPRLFATAVMDGGTNYSKVYSLAQCTPDLSSGDCHACLSHLLGMVNFAMYLHIGGQMGAIRCYFRYEASWFYGSKPMLNLGQLSAPAPVPATTKPQSESGPVVAACNFIQT